MNNTVNTVNHFHKQKTYYIYNKFGLGDSVFNMIFFRIIKYFITHNNIKIYYYTKQEYITQLQEFIYDNPNIILNTINKKPEYSLELWINTTFFGYTHNNAISSSNTKIINYNIFYKNFFNVVLKKLKFNISINKLVYYDEDLLNRYNLLPDKYKMFDILILNSTPFSGQYNYKKNIWDNYIIKLNDNFKLLTTTKVHGVLCTYDDKLTIKDIAALSTKAKVIIAINSGVVPGLLNYYTLTNVKHFYIFDNRCFYSYPNFENKNSITDITFEELDSYLN
jgi:hypothetical protein